MSQTATAARTTRPASRAAPRARSTAPSLRVVTPPSRARAFDALALATVLGLALGLLTLLMVNISLGNGVYRVAELKAQATQLSEQRQSLREGLEAQQAPQELARRARTLGMVPAPNAAFVRLQDGRVLGTPTSAPAPVVPSPSPAPSPSPSAGARAPALPSTSPTAAP
jgi:hypothetical protein